MVAASLLGGWAAFGFAVRWVQLGIQWRPYFHGTDLWGYPAYAVVAASIGYGFERIEEHNMKLLVARREKLLEKRRRAAEAGVAITNQAA